MKITNKSRIKLKRIIIIIGIIIPTQKIIIIPTILILEDLSRVKVEAFIEEEVDIETIITQETIGFLKKRLEKAKKKEMKKLFKLMKKS